MKRNILFVLVVFAVMTVGTVFAQQAPMRDPGLMGLYNLQLSNKQRTQIDKLRLEFEKEISPLRDKVRSLENAYRLMIVDEKVSTTQLKSQLQEISAKKQQLALKRALQQRKIRSLLTDEQKVKFDQRIISGPKPHRMHGFHKGRRGMLPKGMGPMRMMR